MAVAVATFLSAISPAAEASVVMERTPSEVRAALEALLGCGPRESVTADCPWPETRVRFDLLQDPINGTIDTVTLSALAATYPDPDPELEARSREIVLAIVRYVLPEWEAAPLWLSQAFARAVRSHAKQVTRAGNITVVVEGLEESIEDAARVGIILTKVSMDDPLVRGAAPRWRLINALPLASDRAMLAHELQDLGRCDGSLGTIASELCERARGTLVPLPGLADLLVLRSPNAAGCRYVFVVFGPADRTGRRERMIPALCTSGLEIVRPKSRRTWPDLRFTGFVRCDRDQAGERFYWMIRWIDCWDMVLRWNGAEWMERRRVEFREVGDETAVLRRPTQSR
jgi:hypothetical protein